jgi:segregation and condensation protein B
MALSHAAALEAILFASGEPVERRRLATLIGVALEDFPLAIEELRDSLAGRGISLIESGNELELRTAAEAGVLIKKMREAELTRDLGKAGLEALAIILYREGATRSEVDWIRGVNSAQTVRSLMLRGLVNRTEDPADKRKYRYTATTDALAHLGISRKEDLPRYAELSKESDAAIAKNDHADA